MPVCRACQFYGVGVKKVASDRPTTRHPCTLALAPIPRQDVNLGQYLREAKAHNVTDLVRVCEASYSSREVEAAGIRLHVRGLRLFESMWVYVCIGQGAGSIMTTPSL